MRMKKVFTGFVAVLLLLSSPTGVFALDSLAPISTTPTVTTTPMTTSPTSTKPLATLDTTAPTVSVLTLTGTAVAGTSVQLTASVSDNVAVTSCSLWTTNSSKVTTKTAMTLTTMATGQVASSITAFKDAGKYMVAAVCSDAAGNSTRGTSLGVIIVAATSTPAPTDTTAPIVGAITPTIATVGTPVTFSAVVSDDVSVAKCSMTATTSAGTSTTKPMTLVTTATGVTSATLSQTYTVADTVSVTVFCSDSVPNIGYGVATSVVVSAAATTNPLPGTTTQTQTPTISTDLNLDTTAPVVGILSPLVATVGVTQKFSASVTEANVLSSCAMALTNTAGTVGVPMTIVPMNVGYSAEASYAFKNAGSFTAFATCKDGSGNEGQGKNVTITVASTSTQTTPGQTTNTTPTSSTVGPVSPLTAVVGTEVALTSALSSTIATCVLSLTDGAGVETHVATTVQGDVAGSTAVANQTFKLAGKYTAVMMCVDTAKKQVSSTPVTIVVAQKGTATQPGGTAPSSSTTTPTTTTQPGGTAPTQQTPVQQVFSVGQLTSGTASLTTELTATAKSPIALSAAISGASSLTGMRCTLYFTTTNTDGTTGGGNSLMTVSTTATGGSADISFTFTSMGQYTAFVQCIDASGKKATGSSVLITVGAAAMQAPVFSVGSVTPITAITGTETQLMAPIFGLDTLDGTVCTLSLLDSASSVVADAKSMGTSMDTVTKKMSASTPFTFQNAGVYTATVTCKNGAGVSKTSASAIITVNTPQASTVKLTVGTPVPVTAVVGTAVTFISPISGATALTNLSCTLSIASWTLDTSLATTDPNYVETYILGSAVTSTMTVATDTAGKMSASTAYTFGTAGQYKSFATCTATAGTASVVATSKPSVTVTVGGMKAQTPPSTPVSSSTGAFKVGTVVPLVAIAGTATTLSAPLLGIIATEGITCTLSLTDITTGTEGIPSAVPMSIQSTDAGNVATASFTWKTTGSSVATASCTDAFGVTAGSNPVTIKIGKPQTTTATGVTAVDTSAPVVGSLVPATTLTGALTPFTFSATDNSGESGLTCFIGMSLGRTPVAKIPATVTSGVGTATFKFLSAGTYSASVLCSDIALNHNSGVPTDVVVTDPVVEKPPVQDVLPPVVGKITPTSAVVGTAVTIGAIASDIGGVASCTLSVDGMDQGAMTLDNGAASVSYTFTKSGYVPVVVSCSDSAGNVGKSKEFAVNVMGKPDLIKPVVGTIPQTEAIAEAPVTVTATVSDSVGIAYCSLIVDGKDAGRMALRSGTATATTTIASEGTHTAYAACTDTSGNIGSSTAPTTIEVAVASVDITAPTITTMTTTSATQNTPTDLTVTATDESGIASCNLFINDVDQGPMTANSTGISFTRSYTFADSGSFTTHAQCTDNVGNMGIGTGTTVNVSPVATATTSQSDTVSPTVSAIEMPTDAVVGEPVEVTVVVADSTDVASCELYVDSTDVGAMTIADDGTASYLYTVPVAGTTVANAYCVDTAGNATRGASTLTTVEEAVEPVSIQETVTNPDAGATPGSLIKLACYANSDVNDPCKAVYFYSAKDGKRHVFTNENDYFTWYGDWNNVTVVSDSFMASVPLGKNVVYRPGVKLVKFDSSNKVYVVTKGGVLREVPSEDVAAILYGTDWNKKVDAISDAFYSNYTFGEPLPSSTDFNPTTEQNAVTSIDSNMQ